MNEDARGDLRHRGVMRGLNKKILSSRLARDTAWSFVIKISAKALGFAVAVLLARSMGADGYGVYAYAFALVTLLALPAEVGFPTLLVRETARGMAANQPELVKGVWRWTGRATGVLSAALVTGALVVLLVANNGALDERGITMLLAFLLVPFAALGSLRGAALRGLDRIVAGQLPEDIVRPALLLLIVGALALFDPPLGPSGAMAAHVIAAAVAFAVGAWLLLRHTPAAVRHSEPRSQSKSWLAASLPLALIAGLATVNSQSDILMLGIFDSTAQVGIYRVAIQLAALAAFGLQAVNMVIAPRFARLYQLGDMAKLQRLVTVTARGILGFSLTVAALFVVAGEWLVVVVFGDEFVSSYAPLLIMLGGQLVSSAAGSVGHLLNMTGHERDTLRATALAAALNVALNLALIPLWGILGAAVATSVSLSARNLWQWWYVRKRLGINSLAFGAVRH